jgi:ankyrin repeat protein
LLLETDADVDQADLGGRTPLLAAASMGHGHIVELLLFWGCYVDSIDAEGRTVLSIACAQVKENSKNSKKGFQLTKNFWNCIFIKGSVDVVRLLLDRGLDEAHRDNAGWTPLHYAAFEGHSAVVDLLLEVGARMEATDNDGRAPMLLATQEGHLLVVERLIELGADVDQKSLDGKTPLRVAALESHTSVLSALVEAGADVTAKDPDGRSTLYLLAIENKLEQVEIILSKSGVKYNLEEDRDLEGRTPLHIASWQGHTAMVELLLRYGADVNAVDREQRTPLQSSAWQGHESVVWLLLKAGARGDQPCSQGATPLSIGTLRVFSSLFRSILSLSFDRISLFGSKQLRKKDTKALPDCCWPVERIPTEPTDAVERL